MSFLWATRGYSWGFRFLRTGGFVDPLPVYDRAFAGAPDEPELWRREGEEGYTAALRFPDPLDRRDRSGRVIPHEFVVSSPLAGQIESVEAGRRLMWPLVVHEFALVWDSELPPSSRAE